MFWTNVKIVAVVLATLGGFTLVANVIPQVESDVPRQITFTADMPLEELLAIGEELYRGVGACTACHEPGTRGPPLMSDYQGTGPIGERCAQRVPGVSCEEYLWTSLTEPNRYGVENYPPIMPDARRTLSVPQIWAIVAFLQSVGGEVTVTPEDVAVAAVENDIAAPPAPPANGPPEPVDRDMTDPVALLGAHCLMCHQLGGEGTELGPPLDRVGVERDATWIRRKILDPQSLPPAAGYEALAGLMPTDFGAQLNAAQLEAIVSYLAGLQEAP